MVFDDKKLDLAYEMGLPFLNVSVVNVISGPVSAGTCQTFRAEKMQLSVYLLYFFQN